MRPCATFFASFLRHERRISAAKGALYNDEKALAGHRRGAMDNTEGLDRELSCTYRNVRRKCLATGNGE